MPVKGEQEEFISVPVPKRVYPAVARIIADALAETSGAREGRIRGWTASEIAILKGDLKNKTAITLLDMTARRAGQWVTFEELCTEAGRKKREAMGDLAGFTQHIKLRLKKVGSTSKDVWPLDTEWNAKGSPRYRMPVEIAQWWKET